MIHLSEEQPDDAGAIETILDAAFGQDRHAKSSYRYRIGVERLGPLCLVGRGEQGVVGTIRFWPITVGNTLTPTLLLGPVAVDPATRSRGLGARLIRTGLARAEAAGYRLAILVGDESYYGRFGFVPASRFNIVMPKENAARVLACPLGGIGVAEIPAGAVRKWRGKSPASEFAFAA
jgi:predicted N-acetyltransferase YhbS